MAFDDCIREIREAAGFDASEDEVRQALDLILARRARRATTEDPAEGLRAATAELLDQVQLAARAERRKAIMNQRKRVSRDGHYLAAPDLVTGVEAKLVGTSKIFEGARLSVEAQGGELTKRYRLSLTRDIERAGLFDVARRGSLDRQVAREMWELTSEAGRPDITGDPHARRLAEIYTRHLAVARQDQNRAGAWIGQLDGYITRTSHDPDKVLAAGLDGWRATIGPLLDERTFDGVEVGDRARFLDGAWKGIVTGVHLTVDGAQGFKDPAFTGPGNLAKRLSQGRVLHFKDADAFMEYRDAFGHGALSHDVLAALDNGARNTALMREFGTNPRAEFEADIRRLQESQRDKVDQVRALGERRDLLGRFFDKLDGTAYQPVNRQRAAGFEAWRALQLTSKLGNVLISSVTDVPLSASELRFEGAGMLERYGAPLESLVRGRGAGEAREILDDLAAGYDGVISTLASRMALADGTPGNVAWITNNFLKWSGLNWWTDAQRGGAIFQASRILGRQRELPWAEIKPQSRRLLGLYRIGEAEWEALRRLDWRMVDGVEHLTPDRASHLPDDAVDGLIAPRLAELRQGAAARRADAEAQAARAEQRIGELVERYEGELERGRERLAAQQDRRNNRLAAAAEAAQVRLDALAVRIAEAREAAAWRVAAEAVPTEGAAGAGFAIGRRFGEQRRAAEQAMGKVRARTAELERGMVEANDAEARAFLDRFTERGDELARATEELRARVAQRFEVVDAAEARLPERIARERDDFRQDLAIRLRTLFVDRGNVAVIEPGIRERTFLDWGTRRGEWRGEVLRTVMQFKAFPTSVMTKAWGRDLAAGEYLGLAELIAGSIVFGYLAMTAKDMLRGRTPRDPNDIKTWASALAQGGGFGIYGDFIVGDVSRTGKSLGGVALGPSFGIAEDLLTAWHEVAHDGQPRAALGPLFRGTINNAPYVNMFYSRLALDYLILWRLQDMASPGSLRRLERKAERENHQGFWLRPTEYLR